MNLIKPVRPDDIQAGLPLYTKAGEFLGVALGPPAAGLVEVSDETSGEPKLDKIPWLGTRIGQRVPS